MIIDLNEYKDIIQNEVICKKIIKGDLLEHESKFIDNFMVCVDTFGWYYHDGVPSRETIITLLLDFIYRTMVHVLENHYYKKNIWNIDYYYGFMMGSGRILVQAGELDITGKHAWLDIDLSCTL